MPHAPVQAILAAFPAPEDGGAAARDPRQTRKLIESRGRHTLMTRERLGSGGIMPTALFARYASFIALFLLFLAAALPLRAATVQILHFNGAFQSAARPGSDPIFQSLAGGSFRGTYSVPAGSLPGTPGGALVLPDFRVSVLTATGQTVFRFLSGRDSGALFFDFFGPGTGDGFVFNGGGVQFQIGLVSGFTGKSPITSDAIFGGTGGPVGGIGIASGTAYVPLPLPAAMLAGALVLLAAARRMRPGGAR